MENKEQQEMIDQEIKKILIGLSFEEARSAIYKTLDFLAKNSIIK